MCRYLVSLSLLPVLMLLVGCDGAGSTTHLTTKVLPVVVTRDLPRATRGSVYSFQLSATSQVGSGPLTWTLAPQSQALPSGISLLADGTLTGTPVASGLFLPRFRCTDAQGLYADVSLNLAVYEKVGYTHSPDMYDVPPNDTFGSATDLGAISMSAPIVQQSPLSVTSNPADPNTDPYDYFSFTTPHRGRIQIEVYFDSGVGKLLTNLGGEHFGVPESIVKGVAIAAGNDARMVLDDAAPGHWYLKVEAQFKSSTWNCNSYSFRITFNDLTITSSLVEVDTDQSVTVNQPLQATLSGIPVTSGSWSLVSGALPVGVSLGIDGVLRGTPAGPGLFEAEVALELGSYTTARDLRLRIFDSAAGNFWQQLGEHRYYDSTRTHGDGEFHEHYCEATVVAPHPAYGSEGAIYVIGGRVADTVSTVYVFHTAHQSNPDLNYKLEDIGRPLSTARQYLGAVFLQHTYGGYIYVVGGELYSNTAPSTGDFTRVVERMKVADGSGVALATPGNWESLAELPDTIGGRSVAGWAEAAVVTSDVAVDADDRIYLLAGRLQVETSVGSSTYAKELNESVLMYEAPANATGSGTWNVKSDATPYTPRRFPAAGMIDGRVYLAGGMATSGVLDTIEMYQPDPTGPNAAISILDSSHYPALVEPVYYAAAAVHNDKLYVLNGWQFSGFTPTATRLLEAFSPNAGGTGGTIARLATPDNGSGYHSAVFHDDKLWFITGREEKAQTPHYSLRYTPIP